MFLSELVSGAVTPARKLGTWLVGLPRYPKRALLALADFGLLSCAMWFSLSLRHGRIYLPDDLAFTLLLLLAPALGVAVMFHLRIYKFVTRFMSSQRLVQISLAIGLSVLIWGVALFLANGPRVPRAVPFIYFVFGSLFLLMFRQAVGWLLRSVGYEIPYRDPDTLKPVIVYGAGSAGVALVDALRKSGQYQPVGFVDPAPSLWGQYVAGIKVAKPSALGGMIAREDVEELLVALPEFGRRERSALLRDLQAYPVRVKMLPALEDIASGRVTISDLRPVTGEDLLGRNAVPPDPVLLARNTRDKNVLVTGAGGTIGGELVRQILRQGPRRLFMLDASETALYEIDAFVQGQIDGMIAHDRSRGVETQIEAFPILASVEDAPALRALFERHDIHTIYHAAAYKHVPIVEHNVVIGLRNNTFGTATLVEEAKRAGVGRVVLISTDKAVRPTSVMGASKRLAEMILQAHAAEGSSQTVLTMVRFGNVLDSSGSVVRKFRKQIEAGGPVTVTHPHMIRYFMSIPEAASLVIQAGAMANGGEVFVLDMGEPVKIDDLARSMIRLSGLQVRDEANPDGDVAIEYVGLRPGEKLHEELLLGDNTTGTEHSRILRINDPFLPRAELDQELAVLAVAMRTGDVRTIHAILQRVVEGYRPDTRHLDAKIIATSDADVVVSRILH